MKIITTSGVKQFNYYPKTRIIDITDGFKFGIPRNDLDTPPEEYIP